MPTEPTPTPETEPASPTVTRATIEVTTEEDEQLVAAAEAKLGHASRSHVVTEEPSLQAAAATPGKAKSPVDESKGEADEGDGDAEDDEPNAASADAGDSDDDAAGKAGTGDEAGDGDKPKSRRARKTARLQKELADARDRIATLERQAQEATPTEPLTEPEADDYASWDEYAEAKAEYLATQKLAEQSPKDSSTGGAGDQGQKKLLPQSWGEVIDKYADFDDVAFASKLQVNEQMVNQLVDMNEEGAETLYYLGKHPDQAKRIASVTGEIAVARELAKIAVLANEAGKSTGNGAQPPTTEAANVAPTVSNAPRPITPTEGGGAQGRAVDLENASPEEYRRIRREQMAARG